MKKKIVRFAAFTLALLMLPGCGKGRTPAEPTTVNQAMLLEQSAKEQTEYTFPEKFTGDWVSQEGRLTIHADAQVVAELGDGASHRHRDAPGFYAGCGGHPTAGAFEGTAALQHCHDEAGVSGFH